MVERARRARPWLLTTGIVCSLCALCAARMLLAARSEVALAERALREGRPNAAVRRHLRRAMAYYVPTNPWVRQAERLLVQQARNAENRHQHAEALADWRALRSAILALRWAVQPFSADLPAINARIAALTAHDQGASRQLKSAQGAQDLLHRLQTPEAPHPLWTATALIGLALWLAAGFSLIRTGLTAELRIVPKRFVALAVLVGAGLVLFCAGLALA